MFFYFRLFIFLFFLTQTVTAQQLITRDQAVALALRNQVNTAPAQLSLLQQQQLLKSAANIDNPDLEYEIDPYDPTVLGVLIPLRLPSVYASRVRLQRQRIRLSELMLKLNEYEISRLVQNTYTEVQYLQARVALLAGQDSLYQSIKTAAQRNFDAGQINKLEELFASNEANNVRNELEVTAIELAGQKQALIYIANIKNEFIVDSLSPLPFDAVALNTNDSLPGSIQRQILQQQVSVSQQQLKAEKAELLPVVTTGPLFGMQNPIDEPRRLGLRVGVSIPLWLGQNRSRIRAAQTGIQLAEAESARELQRIRADYQTANANLLRFQKSIRYYTTTANPQANAIIETARRLFSAGEMNYIETIRNIIVAFTTKDAYLETIRNYNQAVIELKLLTGNF